MPKRQQVGGIAESRSSSSSGGGSAVPYYAATAAASVVLNNFHQVKAGAVYVPDVQFLTEASF